MSAGGGPAAAGSPLPSPTHHAGRAWAPLLSIRPPTPPQVSAEPSGVSRMLSQAAGRQSIVNPKPLQTRERIRAIVRTTLLFKGAPCRGISCRRYPGCGRCCALCSGARQMRRGVVRVGCGIVVGAPAGPHRHAACSLPPAGLDEEQQGQVIDAMAERKVAAGEVVIQ